MNRIDEGISMCIPLRFQYLDPDGTTPTADALTVIDLRITMDLLKIR